MTLATTIATKFRKWKQEASSTIAASRLSWTFNTWHTRRRLQGETRIYYRTQQRQRDATEKYNKIKLICGDCEIPLDKNTKSGVWTRCENCKLRRHKETQCEKCKTNKSPFVYDKTANCQTCRNQHSNFIDVNDDDSDDDYFTKPQLQVKETDSSQYQGILKCPNCGTHFLDKTLNPSTTQLSYPCTSCLDKYGDTWHQQPFRTLHKAPREYLHLS